MSRTYVVVSATDLELLRCALATALDALDRLEEGCFAEPLPEVPCCAAPTSEELAELF